MPEAKIGYRSWEAAKNWAEKNARRLGLRAATGDTFINLTKRTRDAKLVLYFEAFNHSKDALERIDFSAKFSHSSPILTSWNVGVSWHPSMGDPRKVPESLKELIQTEHFLSHNTKETTEAADAFPVFHEAYEGIMRELFPPYEHHELHTDIGEYGEYEEAIAIDDALLSRLRESSESVPRN